MLQHGKTLKDRFVFVKDIKLVTVRNNQEPSQIVKNWGVRSAQFWQPVKCGCRCRTCKMLINIAYIILHMLWVGLGLGLESGLRLGLALW